TRSPGGPGELRADAHEARAPGGPVVVCGRAKSTHGWVAIGKSTRPSAPGRNPLQPAVTWTALVGVPWGQPCLSPGRYDDLASCAIRREGGLVTKAWTFPLM